MKTIILITQTSKPCHPAVGYSYRVSFDDLSFVETTDDELLAKYKAYRKRNVDVSCLIGKIWKQYGKNIL